MLKFIKTYQSDIILALAVILISAISFNIGKISALNDQKAQIKITGGKSSVNQSVQSQTANHLASADSPVVASKNSKGKLYHFAWCLGASKIAEKNKITFQNEAAAIAAGYTLAGNCKK